MLKKFILFILVLGSITALAYGFIRYQDQKLNEYALQIPTSKWDAKYSERKIKNKYNVAILAQEGGEWQYAYYFQEAAKKFGWNVEVYYQTFVGRESDLKRLKPDFLIVSSVGYELEISPEFDSVKRYIFYTIPFEKIFHMDSVYLGKLRTKYKKKLSKYDGFLITPLGVDVFKSAIEKTGKRFEGMNIFPSTYDYAKNYHAPEKIFYGSFNADKLRASKKYKQMLSLLAQEDVISFYGPKHAWGGFEKNWGGMLPKEELLEKINQHGVALVLHSESHFKSNIPTGRIFEAASAKAVIISDRNKFVEDNFGDSILYIDVDKSGVEMAEQISKHYKWIKEHPVEAEKLAQKSHQIFKEKFAIERDLVRIAKMHEAILEADKR